MYVSHHLLGRSTSLGLFQWAYDFRQGKKTVKTKKVRAWKMTKKNLFVTFKKPEKPLLLWYAQILCKLVFATCVSSYSKRLHGFCVVSRVKCTEWACGVSVSSVSGSFDAVLLLGLGRDLNLWVTGFLLGETGEKRVRWLIQVFLNCRNFQKALAKPPGSTVFLCSLTFVFRYWYLFV